MEMTTKPDYKKYGFIPQRQKGLLLMRVRNRAGNLSAQDLNKIADLAQRFGTGEVHLTMRQGIEIPGVKEERFAEALQAIRDVGLLPAVCGARVRPIVACPGNSTCPYGLQNTRILAEELDEQFVGRDLPAKTKVAISGCPNSCTKPQANDIGFKGAVEPLIEQNVCVKCGACVKRCPAQAMKIENEKLTIDDQKCLACGVCTRLCPKQALSVGQSGYHVYVGGKGGRYSGEGVNIAAFVPADQAAVYLEAILAAYKELTDGKERLMSVIGKVGKEVFVAKVAEKLS